MSRRALALVAWAGVVSFLVACGDEGGKFNTGPGPDEDGGASVWPDAELITTPAKPYEASQTMYSHSGDTLFRIDPEQLNVVTVGAFWPNAPHMTDLAVTPDGRLYAISNNNLFEVDGITAEVTWVAKVPGQINVALTFDKDGTLLAADKSGGVRRIDPQSGQVTEIGVYGDGMGSSGDLVGLSDGRLYDVNDVGSAKSNNELIIVSPVSGQATRVGSIGFRMVWGLSFWGGTLYGFTRNGDFLSIDPASGQGTLIHGYAHEFWGAAVTPKAPLVLQ